MVDCWFLQAKKNLTGYGKTITLGRRIKILSIIMIPVPITFFTYISVKKTRVPDDVITRDKTEYSSHALAEVMDG